MLQLGIERVVVRSTAPVAVDVDDEVRVRLAGGHRQGVGRVEQRRLGDVAPHQQVRTVRADVVELQRRARGDLTLRTDRPLLHVRIPRLRRLTDGQERVGLWRRHPRRRETREQRIGRLEGRRLTDGLDVIAAADIRIDVCRAVDFPSFRRVEEDAVTAADDGLFANRPPGKPHPRCEHLEAIGVLRAAAPGVLVIDAVGDAAFDQRLVGHHHAAGPGLEIAPRHAVARFVGHVAVVPAQAEIHGQPRIDAPVVLDVRGEVLEVELARIARRSRHAERRRLEDADARVVPSSMSATRSPLNPTLNE